MSYSVVRTSVVRGPAVLILNNGDAAVGDQYFFSSDSIKLEFGHQTFDVTNSAFGLVDKRAKERTCKITFTPLGEAMTSAKAKILWPYIAYNFQPGDSAFKNAATEPYIIVIPKSGAQYKFFGAVVSKSPTLMLAAEKTQVGSVEVTAIGTAGVDWAASGSDGPTGTGSLYTATATTYATALTAANFLVATVKTAPYIGTYGTSIGSGATGTFSTNSGFTVSVNAQMQPVETDEFGLFDFTIGDVSASAQCAPLDVTADQISALIPMQTTSRGASLQSGINLVIDVPSSLPSSSGLLYTTLTNASIFTVGFEYNTASQRIPQLQFQTVRQFSPTGALGGSPGLIVPATINIH